MGGAVGSGWVLGIMWCFLMPSSELKALLKIHKMYSFIHSFTPLVADLLVRTDKQMCVRSFNYSVVSLRVRTDAQTNVCSSVRLFIYLFIFDGGGG